ncbi:hypothetical protein ACEPAI_3800 [Sanghuangporus weigelae]
MKVMAEFGPGDNAVTLGKVGHGIMLMTWVPTPVPDEQAFESLKVSLDSVPPGAKMVLNSAEFYGMTPREANLEMLARFFEKYPSYTEKAFLAVKGGTGAEDLSPDSSPANLKRSVDNILAKLRGTKKLDVFQCARVDRKYPIEETIKVLSGFVKEGKFDHIGLSEAKASTVSRANDVHPIALVEIEISPWCYDDPVKEVIATCEELGVIILAYSPLGRGFLSGKYKSIKDLEEGDIRKHTERFQEEYLKNNMAIVEGIQTIAARKGVTPAQLCIAWVSSLSPQIVPIPGSSMKERTQENCAAADIQLIADDVEAVKKVLEQNPVKGNRYGPGSDEDWHLWG